MCRQHIGPDPTNAWSCSVGTLLLHLYTLRSAICTPVRQSACPPDPWARHDLVNQRGHQSKGSISLRSDALDKAGQAGAQPPACLASSVPHSASRIPCVDSLCNLSETASHWPQALKRAQDPTRPVALLKPSASRLPASTAILGAGRCGVRPTIKPGPTHREIAPCHRPRAHERCSTLCPAADAGPAGAEWPEIKGSPIQVRSCFQSSVLPAPFLSPGQAHSFLGSTSTRRVPCYSTNTA